MKKIYSFVLMATMLLVGTNSWAAYQIGSTNYATLQAAIGAAQDGDVINVTPGTGLSITTQVELNADKHIILDLNDNSIEFNYGTNGTRNAALVVRQGILEIRSTGSTKEAPAIISNVSADTYDLIRLYGQPTDATDLIDAKIETPYSQVIIREGVKIQTSSSNTMTITENAAGYAYGARIDVYGELKAEKYGIKVNGSVKVPAADKLQYSPYVYVANGAKVATNDNAEEAVAIYASGYARWRVEGNCQGSTGLYARAGQVELVDAHIESTNESTTAPTLGKGSGVEAGGSAIVVESNVNYQGGIQLTIAGETKVVASTNGYAIQETVDTNDPVKVENITIVSGTIQGGTAGAIIVSQKTINDEKADVAVYGGKITSENNTNPIQISNPDEQHDQVNEVLAAVIPGYTEAQTKPTVAPTQVQAGQNTITVLQVTAGYLVTLNAYGLATFSHETSAVELPTDPNESTHLTAYGATGLEGDELTVVPINSQVINSGNGVILYKEGAAGQSFTLLYVDNLTNNDIANNLLRPSTQWDENVHPGAAYILHDNELWIYDGTDFKPNKAFLPMGNNSGAPQRIRMVVAQEEQTEAVSNVEAASVKAVKFVENGEILIRRGENVYNLQGQIVK